jgi:hypothetical protein
MIVVGGEKALYTVWVQDGTNPPKKMREWHVMLPRNGVLIEFVGTCLQSDHVRYDRIIRDTVRSWVWTPPAPPTAAVAPVVPPAPQDPAK